MPEFLAETILQRPERALRTASQQRAPGRTPVSRRAMRRIGPISSTPNCSSARQTWVGSPRSISPSAFGGENNAPRDRCRGSSAGRARRRPPSAPGRSRPCPPGRPETPNRSPRRLIERDNEIKGRLVLEAGVPRALHAASCLAAAAARACADDAPFRAALDASPAQCRCSFSPV
jgi:hypothetical protein